MATDTLPAGSGKFSGLTDDQVLMLFSQIATTANLMAEICRDKADDFGDKGVALTFHALDTMLSSIGAMADMPSNGRCVGGFADWMVGPLFNSSENCESEVSMREQQTAPENRSPDTTDEFTPSVAAALLCNIRTARAVLRAFILAIRAQDDGSVLYSDKAGCGRWHFAIDEVCTRLAQARDALTGTCNCVSVDWFTPLTLAEALDAALWYGSSLVKNDRLNSHEAVFAAQAVVHSLDNMLLECEATGANQIASLVQAPALH